jgi:hypothetical protein
MSKQKEIKRVIYVSDISEIDFDNFGVHFTENIEYNHTGGGSNGLTEIKRFKVTAFVKKYEVNEAATLISREGHPHEKETVLCFDQELNCEISILDNNEFVSFSKRKINTGQRSDIWVKKI